MPLRSSWPRDVRSAVLAAAVLGAFSTFGDWVWASFIPDGAVAPGIVHGVVVFVLLAMMLGGAAGSGRVIVRLLLTLPVAGLALAAAFYPLAGAIGYLGALLATWVGMWLALALLQRWARGGTESTGSALARGAVAAAGSGLAFWSVSGMWTGTGPPPDHPLRLLYWTLAFLPGFLALLVGQRSPSRR